MLKALAAGIPVVCLPMGRDQPDNAARLSRLDAGVRLPVRARPDKIAAAVEKVINEPRYRLKRRADNGGAIGRPADAAIPGRTAAREPRGLAHGPGRSDLMDGPTNLELHAARVLTAAFVLSLAYEVWRAARGVTPKTHPASSSPRESPCMGGAQESS